MINIYILTVRNALVASIADCQHIFSMVNTFLKEQGKAPLFNIQLAGAAAEVSYNGNQFCIRPDLQLDDVKNADLIIIPALTGDMHGSVMLNKAYSLWVATQYKEGVEIACLSSGIFLLAFSGVLKGRQCTTHWSYANELKYFYPAIEVVDERMITDQHGIYSSGGGNAYWNLLLHLVEKYAGREMAIYTAKYFVIDTDKNMQSPFIVFHGLKDHTDDDIKTVQLYIENNYKKKLTVDELAVQFNMSRRTFERRFKKATRSTVAEYIQRVKIEGAKKQLEIGRKSIHEVMGNIGYTDTQTFRNIFRRITGMTPVEYKNKYARKLSG
ncbi:GlxA family transcriptional regulator [Chitinophaga solisilvae]|uniref:Helix-turn-helix domain-containing protein n=1 Tax=Chitinophaga solisilvae TaxID=1233460 RepID=A0A3S1D2K5_9BACT|nr:helix-turn-helix domain-containing protein [Chitinophaga solisilvae]NSL85313.1 helix-turn-helix domain-containing protein [Chitinophaga solisilvae]